MTVLVLVVVVVRPVVGDRGGALVELAGRDEPCLEQHVLQRVEPVLVVAAPSPSAPSRPCAAISAIRRARKILEVDRAGVVERDREAERPALPRRLEDELAVLRAAAPPAPVADRECVGPSTTSCDAPAAAAQRKPGADHAVARDERGELLLAQPSVPCGRIGSTR